MNANCRSSALIVHRIDLARALALRELRRRYAGTGGGLIWSVLVPAAMVCIYWLVFSVGLKIRIADGRFPFICWFLCGYVPWLLIGEVVGSSTGCILQHAWLVRKVAFPLEVIPVSQLLVGWINHGLGLMILLLVMLLSGLTVPVTVVALLYYGLAMTMLVLALALLSAALNVVVRDVGHLVPVILNMWFWLTPVVWPLSLFEGQARLVRLLQLNPATYVISGYRAALLEGQWVAGPWWWPILFWAQTLVLLALGGWTFYRLKGHFVDVL